MILEENKHAIKRLSVSSLSPGVIMVLLLVSPGVISFVWKKKCGLMKGFWTGEYLTNLCFPWISFIIFDRNISGQPVNYQGNPLEIMRNKDKRMKDMEEIWH